MQDWIAGPGSCKDYTMERGTCRCRPDVYTDCAVCTRHLGCVWVKEARTTVTTTAHLPIVGDVTTSTHRDWSDVCWQGDGFRGPFFTQSIVHTSAVQIKLNYTSSKWSWAQCEVDGAWTAMGVTLGLIVLVYLTLSLLRCICCSRAGGTVLQ